MGVSVIIPYYHGNKYLENLSKVLADNIKEYEVQTGKPVFDY